MPPRHPGQRARLLPLTLLVAAVILGGVAYAAHAHRAHPAPAAHTPPPAAAPTAQASGATTALPGPRARQIAAALTSPDRAVTASVLADGVRQAYLSSGAALLPAGTTLTVQADRMRVTGTTATVPAQLSGPVSGPWTLLLVQERGTWWVYAAVRAS